MSGGDVAKVSVLVAVAPAYAFEVFTTEIDLWWKQGPKFRIAGRRRGQLHLESGVGGRLFESFVARRPRAPRAPCRWGPSPPGSRRSALRSSGAA